ncbi:MAG: ABC transporter ATP-binding protein [Candidatus Paceibacterota bacterium]
MTKKTSYIKLTKCSLEFKLNFRRQTLKVLNQVTVDIKQGEFFVFLGPSGSGKSTLLRVMSGIEKGYTGSMETHSELTTDDMSFVFQQFALFPWLTVYDNIALGLLSRNESEAVIKKKVLKEAKELGLDKFLDSYPKELSGGMKQRVGIARALVTDPKVIFMDEPFSGLDSFIASELRKELLRIWEEKGITIILVTHLVSEAVEMADRIAIVTPRPATIEKIIENKLARPRKHRTKTFYALEDKITEIVRP